MVINKHQEVLIYFYSQQYYHHGVGDFGSCHPRFYSSLGVRWVCRFGVWKWSIFCDLLPSLVLNRNMVEWLRSQGRTRNHRSCSDRPNLLGLHWSVMRYFGQYMHRWYLGWMGFLMKFGLRWRAVLELVCSY
jgi:hypothetical protein